MEGEGLVWILPELELPKISLKCDKVCQSRYDAALQDLMFPISMVFSDVDKYFDIVERNFARNLTEYLEGLLNRQKIKLMQRKTKKFLSNFGDK